MTFEEWKNTSIGARILSTASQEFSADQRAILIWNTALEESMRELREEIKKTKNKDQAAAIVHAVAIISGLLA